MRIVRFLDENGVERTGSQIDDSRAHVIDGCLFGAHEVTDQEASIKKLLAPVRPVITLCIGLNYQKHADESGLAAPKYPVLFIKAPNTLQNPNDPILIPKVERDHVDYECELAVIIKKPAKNVSREEALDYVLGYTCANDVSGRDWQINKGGSQWNRGKSFDTFCPMGPALVTTDEIPNPNDLGIKTVLNGDTVQDWTTSDMIFDVPELISFLSQSTTLPAGTAILTGTPQGVGFARKPPLLLKAGDTVTIEIEKIGALTNPVENEE